MNEVKKDINQFISLGNEYIIRGQYEKALDIYITALEHNSDHYLIRNALGEIYFIQKEFIVAADNFWLAALDESKQIDFKLIHNNKIKQFTQLQRKKQEIIHAKKIILNYTRKTGISLFADQYENPLKKNIQQAIINLYRQKIDPCGYKAYTEADPQTLKRVEKNIQMIGYRFLKKKNSEQKKNSLEKILKQYKDILI